MRRQSPSTAPQYVFNNSLGGVIPFSRRQKPTKLDSWDPAKGVCVSVSPPPLSWPLSPDARENDTLAFYKTERFHLHPPPRVYKIHFHMQLKKYKKCNEPSTSFVLLEGSMGLPCGAEVFGSFLAGVSICVGIVGAPHFYFLGVSSQKT